MSNISEKPITTQPTANASIFTRAVDSFKRPVDWDRKNNLSGAEVYVRDVEQGEKSPSDRSKNAARTGDAVMDEDDESENGGLKRRLHGRHLQVCVFYFCFLGSEGCHTDFITSSLLCCL